MLLALPRRRSRNWVKRATHLFSLIWSWLLFVQWYRILRILTLHLFLWWILFLHAPEERLTFALCTSASKLTSSSSFLNWHRKDPQFDDTGPGLSRKTADFVACTAELSRTGHRTPQQGFPRGLRILSYSNPVIFQMTWGFESKWSSETASAAKFFLDLFGNDKKLPLLVVSVFRPFPSIFYMNQLADPNFLGDWDQVCRIPTKQMWSSLSFLLVCNLIIIFKWCSVIYRALLKNVKLIWSSQPVCQVGQVLLPPV